MNKTKSSSEAKVNYACTRSCMSPDVCIDFSLQERVEAKKPAPYRWALRGTGRASGATGYLTNEAGWFSFWRKEKGGEKR